MSENNSLPIACNMGVFSPEARERHAAVVKWLKASVLDGRELPDGRRYRFAPEPSALTMLAEFIALERLCCPFFEFTLRLGSGSQTLWLDLTGPEGTREFVSHEFRGMP